MKIRLWWISLAASSLVLIQGVAFVFWFAYGLTRYGLRDSDCAVLDPGQYTDDCPAPSPSSRLWQELLSQIPAIDLCLLLLGVAFCAAGFFRRESRLGCVLSASLNLFLLCAVYLNHF